MAETEPVPASRRPWCILALLAVPQVVRNDYFLHLFIVSAIFALLAQGLNLIVGYVGQLSLAHGAFFALGAYASALLVHHAQVVDVDRVAGGGRRHRAASRSCSAG